jgi:hypothetical protein
MIEAKISMRERQRNRRKIESGHHREDSHSWISVEGRGRGKRKGDKARH